MLKFVFMDTQTVGHWAYIPVCFLILLMNNDI